MSDTPQPEPRPKRRWYQFHLWHLFVLVTVIAIGCSWFACLEWIFGSLGYFYGVVIPLTGLAVFVGACLVVTMTKRPAPIASYLVIVPLPLLIGIYGSIQGVIVALTPISHSGLSGAAMARGVSTALWTTLVGLLITGPSYLVVAIALFVRVLLCDRDQTM